MAAVVSGPELHEPLLDLARGVPEIPAPQRVYEILVVDPDPATTAAVQAAMPDAHVRQAGEVYSALYEVVTDHVDLIVAELRLPGASIFELLQRLRACRWTRVPVVVLSHARDSGGTLRALGVYAVLGKPVAGELLHDTLQHACEISSRHMCVMR